MEPFNNINNSDLLKSMVPPPSGQPTPAIDYNNTLNQILTQYPKLKNIYGEQGQNFKIAENNQIPNGTEFFQKTLLDGNPQTSINYGNISLPHPNPGGYGLLVDPSKLKGINAKEAILGEMLHGMKDDSQYNSLYNNFYNSYKQSSLPKNTKYWFDKANEDTQNDGYPQFEHNDVDARVRSIFQPSDEGYKYFQKEMTPDMKNAANDIQLYLTSNKEGKSMINLPSNYKITDLLKTITGK